MCLNLKCALNALCNSTDVLLFEEDIIPHFFHASVLSLTWEYACAEICRIQVKKHEQFGLLLLFLSLPLSSRHTGTHTL